MQEPVVELADDTAWGYLASQSVGRLAVSTDGVPEIFPVNYALDGEFLIFRTAEGSKLEAMALNNHVAFEVDGWDEERGWSVIVTGTVDLIHDEDEIRRLSKAPLKPWVPTVKKNWVRIVPDQVTARSFNFGEEPSVD